MTSPDLTTREHSLRVGALEALSFAVNAEYEQAREDAETAFKVARTDGDPQKEVLLPDGTVAGRISIKEGVTITTVHEDVLIAHAKKKNPDALEEYFDPSVLEREDVAEVLRAVFPDTVSHRVRKATRTAYLKEAEAHGGLLIVDDKTGETVRIFTAEKSDPTGAFTFSDRKPKERRAAIMHAIRTDPVLRAQVLGGALALGPGGGDQSAAGTEGGGPDE